MVERICGICGGVWGKSFKFCPSDGSLLVAVDTIVPVEQPRPKRVRRSDPAIEVDASRRRPSMTREFREQRSVASGEQQWCEQRSVASGEQPWCEQRSVASGEPATSKPDWTSPIFTLRKSHAAAAFDETACHKRPVADIQGALALESADRKGPKTNPHPRFVPRVGGDLMQ